MKALKLKIAGGTAALAAVIGGGAAVAANQLSPTEESDAIVADAAKQLGVSADKLDAALKQALENRVDAAVEAGHDHGGAGRRAEAADRGRRGAAGRRRARFRLITAATTASSTSRPQPSYLGVTEAKLRASLERRRHARRDREGERQDRGGARGRARRRREGRSRREGRGRPADGGPADVDPRRPRVAHRRRRQRRVRVRLPRRARRPAAGVEPSATAPTPDARSPPLPRPGRPSSRPGRRGFLAIS